MNFTEIQTLTFTPDKWASGKSDQDFRQSYPKGTFIPMSKSKRTFRQVIVNGAKPAPEPVAAETFVTPPQLKAETKGTTDEEEIGGYDGPDPTRFGDWEHKGRVTDF